MLEPWFQKFQHIDCRAVHIAIDEGHRDVVGIAYRWKRFGEKAGYGGIGRFGHAVLRALRDEISLAHGEVAASPQWVIVEFRGGRRQTLKGIACPQVPAGRTVIPAGVISD